MSDRERGRPVRRQRGAVVVLLSAALALAAGAAALGERLFELEARRIVGVGFPGGRVDVDVAVTAAERRAGLAGVPHLPADRGLLFVYPDTRPRSFTARGMLFPIDVVAISGRGRPERGGLVTAVGTHLPGEESFDTGPARYVLEVNAGWAEAHGVVPGTPVVLVFRGGGFAGLERPPGSEEPPGSEGPPRPEESPGQAAPP